MKECCGNCKYNAVYIDATGYGKSTFFCDNEESSEYGSPTAYDDSCDDFEEKE